MKMVHVVSVDADGRLEKVCPWIEPMVRMTQGKVQGAEPELVRFYPVKCYELSCQLWDESRETCSLKRRPSALARLAAWLASRTGAGVGAGLGAGSGAGSGAGPTI